MKIVLILIIGFASATIPGLNFSDYVTMCNGKTNCYALWMENNKSSAFYPIFKNYPLIERWPWIQPYVPNTNMNISFAQAHAQAISLRYWYDYYSNTLKSSTLVFKEESFIRAAVNFNMTCASTYNSPSNYKLTEFSFVPFYITNYYYFNMYWDPAFNFDILSPTKWCDKTYLNSINVTGMNSLPFPGYSNYLQYPTYNWQTYSSILKQYGMLMVGVPVDLTFVNVPYFYLGYMFTLSGPILYYTPANVVGVWQPPQNNTLYFIVYAFGSANENTNYLFIQANTISTNGVFTTVAHFPSTPY